MGTLEFIKTMNRSEAKRTAKTVCRSAKIMDCAFILELRFASHDSTGSYINGCLVVDRNTSEKWLSGIFENSALLKQSQLQNLTKMASPRWFINKYCANGLWRTETLKLAVLAALYTLPGVGLSFTALDSNMRRFGEDRATLISVVDELMRAGLVVKAATGGLWWVGHWRKFSIENGELPWISPGVHLGQYGKLVVKKRFYGRKARKNYSPAAFYKGDE